jgi:hypothetical protein
MVDATAVIAVAGIAGTLLGTLLSPVVAERMRRSGARQEQLRAARMELYAELLEVTARLADNAMTWAALPRAELQETEDARLDRILARVRTLASKDVRNHMAEISTVMHDFNRQLFAARDLERMAEKAGGTDSVPALQARSKLASLAERARGLHLQLEKDVRRDVNR